MQKFSQLNKSRRLFEQEITLQTTVATPDSKVEIQSQTQSQSVEQVKPEGQEENTEQKNPEVSVVKFFSKIFESREMAHVYHLTVKGEEGSHAKHEALGTYYESVLPILDELIEIYQGQFEVIEGYETVDTSSAKSTDTVKYFEELAAFIKSQRKNCFNEEDTHYFNLIDDLLVLIFRTLYKLKYNK
jgi:hypothetical protein